MVRIVQISDTHIGRERPLFQRNWPALRDWLVGQAPALVVHSGDVTLDGAGSDDDFAFCAELIAALPMPCLSVPGNHDVGVPGRTARQPVDVDRLMRWRRHFGEDRWVHDLAEWRLVGFDSMIMGSGLPAEEAQFEWIEAAIADAGGRRIAWFCHQPLFIHGYDDPDNGYWSVPPAPRARLEALTQRFDVGLVASGHLHISRSFTIGDTQYVWCPSSAFTVGTTQPPFPGDKQLGAVVLDFIGHEVHVETLHLPTLTPAWIEDVVEEVYPRL